MPKDMTRGLTRVWSGARAVCNDLRSPGFKGGRAARTSGCPSRTATHPPPVRALSDTSTRCVPARARSCAVYWVTTTLGVCGLAVAVLAVVGAVSVTQVDPAHAQQLTLDGHGLSYPSINAAAVLVLGLACVGALVLVRLARELVRGNRARRRA